MIIFGGILPWFGFREMACNRAGDLSDREPVRFVGDFLTLEWLGEGICFGRSGEPRSVNVEGFPRG